MAARKTQMARRQRPNPEAAVTAESMVTRRKNTGVAARAMRKIETEVEEDIGVAVTAETG